MVSGIKRSQGKSSSKSKTSAIRYIKIYVHRVGAHNLYEKQKNGGLCSNVFKMRPALPPVKVSPLIKTARWVLLISGIFYGATKLAALRAYEKIEGPKRKQRYHELHLQKMEEEKRKTAEELVLLGKDLEVTEFPPDWDKDI